VPEREVDILMTSVLVRGGRVVTSSQEYQADVLIVDGKISSVGTPPPTDVDRVVDATGCYIMPGGVDPHTHMDTPTMGTVTSDDFRTGTIAAAVGGTTTIIDFPIQNRGEDPRESVERWFDKARGKAVVDWAFHQIITYVDDATIPALDALVSDGIGSFKLFTAYPGSWMLDDGSIFRVLRRASDNGAFIMFHCENGLAIDVLVQEALAAGHTAPIYHARTRPSTAEGEATERVIALAQMAGVPIYIVHMSAAEALAAVQDARDQGFAVYAETCPHYLLLSEVDLARDDFEGAKYVCSPPLRTGEHSEALWRGLGSGDLQVVSTDHASFCLEGQKEMGRDDFSKIPNGIPGVEWRLPLLYHYGVGQGRLTVNRFVELVSTAPAKLFGLYPRKGEIAPGSDADLVVFDPNRERTLSAADQYTNCDYNPYEGWTVRGFPRTVLLGGQMIVDDSKFLDGSGTGQFVKSGASEALA
jgi:dihydropyrimidinase